jgi:hypothetical protein
MRVLLVALIILGLPLTASAQKHERRSDNAQERQRKTEPPTSMLGPIGLPPLPDHSIQRPWTGGPQGTPWERPQTPWWERQGPPAWERGHVAQPVVPNRNQQRRRSSSVVYVMQPYPVQVEPPEPKIVYVMVPQPAPVAVREPEPEPAPPAPPPPPVFVPIGNRTMYIIPGCYLGNVVPTAAMVPADCDLSRLKIIRP